MGDGDSITVGVDDKGVATLTFNRPEKRNAFNFEMTKRFDEAIWALERDEAVRVIVLTGAGDAYCAGADLSEGGAAFGADAHEEHNRDLGWTDESVVSRIAFWRWRTPVISAINGAAIGAGLTMALLSDVRIAAEDAKLRFVFTRLNMIPEANSTWLLPRIVGLSRAMELLLSGRFFTGREAAEIALVSRALPRDEVLPAAVELAREIATYCAPVAVGITKQLVYRSLEETDRSKACTLETKLTWWTGTQPDTLAGVTANLSRSEPRFEQSKHQPLPAELDIFENLATRS